MNWDEMTPRQRDAWVAERIFGWHKRSLGPIPTGVTVAGSFDDWLDKNGLATYPVSLWNPSQHPGYDYEVLKKVRKEWGGKQDGFMERDRFLFHLRCIISKRVLGDNDWIQQTVAYFYYEPGDYSHAAWMVLGEKICEEKE